MSVNILGISGFYHDSAACLLIDGKIIAAAQEERFTRVKHDPSFPMNSIQYCLKEGNISENDLDIISFYDKPWIKFERLLETYLAYSPKGIKSFLLSIPIWLSEKLQVDKFIRKKIKSKAELLFCDHHESHAASAYFPSPFEDAAILTLDGVGEWTTTSIGIGRKNKIELISEIKFPHSIGLLYSTFTYFLGFKVNSGEYKVMGLAPYGEPKYVNLILDNLIDLKEDGSYKLNMKYFNYCAGLKMVSNKFGKLFDEKPRKPESELTQKHMDIAASIQLITEMIILRSAKYVKKISGAKNLCLAGGVALNCVGNGKILNENIFDNIWIQPAAGDAGGAIGSAFIAWHHYLDKPKPMEENDCQFGSFLGPEFSDKEIENFLIKMRINYKKFSYEEIPKVTSNLIINGKVIGWFQGRMEFGPRALGARSIIGDARLFEMQEKMNLKIKFRESFRPFAPSILEENTPDYFKIDIASPYMLLVSELKEQFRLNTDENNFNLTGLNKLKVKRSLVPAITHVDYSARLHTVNEKTGGIYYKLLKEFYNISDCPLIINTSFNIRGEPIVCTPEDAINCFFKTEMDHLVIGCFIIDKSENQQLKSITKKEEIALD